MTLAWQVRRWHALPNAGGLEDQPVGLIERMTILDSVYQAVSSWHRSKNWAIWSRENPEARGVVDAIFELRKEAEGNAGTE